jgi:uncharacterized protein (TIGR03435 family)
MRRICTAATIATLLAWPAVAEERRFDVASVRPHRAADDVMFAIQFHEGGRLTATGTLRMLIRTAYRLQEFQLDGPRGWMDNERFDIDGRSGRPATPDEMRLMLRGLLRERFGLSLRSVRSAAPVYALRMAGGERGPRLRPAAVACATGACDVRFAPGVLSARGVTMAALASDLSWWIDRMVIDRTELSDRFDLDLAWAPDQIPSLPGLFAMPEALPIGGIDSNAPSIFTAVREQLGLSLEPARDDVEVFVIDRAEWPTAN